MAGRPRSWQNEKDFVEEHRLLIPRPPRCICEAHDYRYGKTEIHVYAKCNVCGAFLQFLKNQGCWRFIFPSVPKE